VYQALFPPPESEPGFEATYCMAANLWLKCEPLSYYGTKSKCKIVHVGSSSPRLSNYVSHVHYVLCIQMFPEWQYVVSVQIDADAAMCNALYLDKINRLKI
jgi:hypothetical protein